MTWAHSAVSGSLWAGLAALQIWAGLSSKFWGLLVVGPLWMASAGMPGSRLMGSLGLQEARTFAHRTAGQGSETGPAPRLLKESTDAKLHSSLILVSFFDGVDIPEDILTSWALDALSFPPETSSTLHQTLSPIITL